MDKTIGGEFDKGLADLNAIARKGGASVPNEKRSLRKIGDWRPRLVERADRV